MIDSIVKINADFGTHISILADLQGPKLRVGKFPKVMNEAGEMVHGKISIALGDILTFTNDIAFKENCSKDNVYMSYELFAKDVEVGEKVLVDDGKVVLEVVETNKNDVAKLKVVHGHFLSSNKGVNLPDTKVSLPALTEKDIEDLDFILTQPVNWIALSFVRTPKDLEDLSVRIKAKNHDAKIIAKIENQEGL